MQPMLSKSRTKYEQDRRWHIRYPVHGTAELEAEGTNYPSIPLELSLGGINFKMERTPPVDQVLKLRLDVYGFGELIVAEVRVIRTRAKTATAIFLTPQSSLAHCISWLSNYDRRAKDRVFA
jgi:PilZ domain-containing protein